ncbi:MAG: glycosyltransferase [Lachnospiraceae bacterium]|nr:glycosyltransferase [Lachnospiraceae bacterium]
MKIYMFIALMGVGGAERVCVSLANEFVKKGQEVHIVVLNLSNDVNTHLLDKRCKVHELGVSRLRYAALPMMKFIHKHKVDTMLVFGNEMGVIMGHLRSLHLIRTKIVLRVLNNVNISLSKEDNVSPVVEAYLQKQQKQMGKMEAVITQCQAMGDMLLEKRLVSKEKLNCIYNPVSEKVVEGVHREIKYDVPAKAKRIVFIGRLDPQKQLEHMIDAFALVKEKYPEGILQLVGDGVLKEKLQEKVKKMSLADSVLFEGVRKDIEHIYEQADVVALSSEYEGMPNCLIEAISAGIPVVSYDCPIGPSEILVDGVNGFLVENGNIQMLADKLSEALGRDWDEKAVKATAFKFAPSGIADQYLEVLKKVSGESNAV